MKTNSLEFKKALREHILSFNDGDSTYTAEGLLRANTYACKHGSMTLYAAAQHTVEGGNYIIYHYDVRQQIEKWGLSKTLQNASDAKQWSWYINTLAAEIVKMLSEQE